MVLRVLASRPTPTSPTTIQRHRVRTSGALKLAKRTPEAMRGAVVLVGDVHGHSDKLRSLWRELEKELGSARFRCARVILLGDLCDRGPDTAGVLSFLASDVPEGYPEMEVRLLAGNHDLGLVTFLNLIPVQGGDALRGYDARRPEPPLWEDTQGAEGEGKAERAGAALAHVGMHLQGRRWGARVRAGTRTSGPEVTTNAFESEPTFASYGVETGDREGLLAAMPDSHKQLLASLEFVVEMDGVTDDQHPEVTKLIAVHAGLVSSQPVREQVASLRAKTVDRQWVEALQGRANVFNLPDSDLPSDVLVASGHHGVLKLDGRRLIVDSCAGRAERPLKAVVLPERLIVESTC